MVFRIDSISAIAPREAVQSLYLQRQVLDATPGGVTADVVTDERIYSVSQLDGESDWTIDGESLHNGLPLFFNGIGARYTLLRKIADPFLIDTLDEAKAAFLAGVDITVVG